ncbi:MAG: alpha-1,2-fucosyltransferase [Bacteroidota bacterium]
MDVVVLSNGLGNQMSQYAFYLQKRRISKSTLWMPFCHDHNGFELKSVFNINPQTGFQQKFWYLIFRALLTDKSIVSDFLGSIIRSLGFKIIKENFDYNFKSNYLVPSPSVTFYYGGWHSEKYFSDVRSDVQKQFTFTEPTDPQNVNHLHDITYSMSVAIHVRRGDYLNADNINLFGDVSTKEYFEKAIALINSKVEDPHFFIFSNDIPWVKENFQMDKVTYVTCNNGENSWKDMFLMSRCKHNIISNSTFSWWGAWLNTNRHKIVISPKRFLKSDNHTDVYPDSWTKITE